MGWRDLAKSELVRQYNNRGLVPDHQDYFATWDDWSEDYRARAPKFLPDISYGKSLPEKLDLLMPDAENPPLHLFIHGGYWQAMGRKNFSFIAEGLNDHGAAVAVMSYGLCPDVKISDIVAQVRRCTAFLLRSGDRLGVDSSRLSISGHSAGGHLGAVLCATDWSAYDARLPNHPISGAVLISGLYELEPIIHTPVNDAVGMTADAAERNSPIFMPPRTRAGISCVVGGDESAEYHRQSDDFVASWAASGAHISKTGIPGTNHFSVVESAFDVNGPILSMIDSQR
ncbi:MAG: alpha/beta hydrolase [Rhodospirillales bacterium]